MENSPNFHCCTASFFLQTENTVTCRDSVTMKYEVTLMWKCKRNSYQIISITETLCIWGRWEIIALYIRLQHKAAKIWFQVPCVIKYTAMQIQKANIQNMPTKKCFCSLKKKKIDNEMKNLWYDYKNTNISFIILVCAVCSF